MESLLLIDALKLTLNLSLYFLGFLGIGVILASIIKAAFLLEDPIVTFIGKFIFLAVVMYLFSDKIFSELMNFAIRIFSGTDIYK